MKPLHESLRSARVADPSLTPLTTHNPRWKVRPALGPPYFQPGADDVHSHQPHPGSTFIVLRHHQCVSVDCCAEVCFLCREELATQSSISRCKRNTRRKKEEEKAPDIPCSSYQSSRPKSPSQSSPPAPSPASSRSSQTPRPCSPTSRTRTG